MKKNRNLILAIIFFELALIAICVLVYFIATSNSKPQEPQEKQGVVTNEPIIDISSYPKVDASVNMQNLANAFMEDFTGKKIDGMNLTYSNAQFVYSNLIDGLADIIISKKPTQEELEYASQKGIEIEYLPIVIDPFVFYTNVENEVSNISVEEIQQIYSGKIIKWSEIGGNDEEIRAYQRNSKSENQRGMIELVMEDTDLIKPITEERTSDDNIPIDIVSDYDNAINSLGYSFYSYAKTYYDESDEGTLDGIKLLKINNVTPNYSNFQNGLYPLTETYYVAIRKNDRTAGITKMIRDAMISNRGKIVAKEAGYIGTKP